jgi:hypothetical protein
MFILARIPILVTLLSVEKQSQDNRALAAQELDKLENGRFATLVTE